MIKRLQARPDSVVFLLIAVWILIGAIFEFHQIAWGTGMRFGQFSLTWFFAFILFVFFCLLIFLGMSLLFWQPGGLDRLFSWLIVLRNKLGGLRWAIAGFLLLLPVYILQYSFWGLVLHGMYLRILLVALSGLGVAWLISRSKDQFLDGSALLVSFVLTSGILNLFISFNRVTDYPFSLAWSEGNRIWDYSVLFGRDVFNYPAGQPIFAYIDIGRQLVGGIPFLMPGVTIWQVRLWLALVDVVPYLIIGWMAFRKPRPRFWTWLLIGIWAFLFVKQGPIHAPLLLCTILVALAWERPLWMAVPLVFVAGYFAVISRYTWIFAPAMWSVMLEFAGAYELNRKVWWRAFAVGIAGAMGGYFGPIYVPVFMNSIKALVQSTGNRVDVVSILKTQLASQFPPGNGFWIGLLLSLFLVVIAIVVLPRLVKVKNWKFDARLTVPLALVLLASLITVLVLIIKRGGAVNMAMLQAKLAAQPLIWGRLLPNDTYGAGILFGLGLAVIPLIVVLVYLARSERWQLNVWQKASIILPLLAFLIVGLIISVKIGGGGDLHNLDMFIIGLMFVAAIAWKNGGHGWLVGPSEMPVGVRLALIAAVVIPAYKPLYQMQPLTVQEDPKRVAVLADISTDPLPNPLPDTIPSEPEAQKALRRIQKAVRESTDSGEILFMDQRQLLTFGYIDVPLVPEYEKKVLIDEAMADNALYFESFYNDLASHRFSLIITSPIRVRLDDELGDFGAENNAWGKWVTRPLSCYYQPLDSLKEVGVELLVPKTGVVDCSSELPH